MKRPNESRPKLEADPPLQRAALAPLTLHTLIYICLEFAPIYVSLPN